MNNTNHFHETLPDKHDSERARAKENLARLATQPRSENFRQRLADEIAVAHFEKRLYASESDKTED